MPRRPAYSRKPFTELWLSNGSTSRERLSNGNASPTSRHAPVAFGVNTTAYSAGSALKCWSTAVRVCSTSSDEASDVGFSECGFPKQALRIRSACASSWRRASPAPVWSR
ncbi:hypothetical protein ACFQ9X_09180 [Catenulispora yoronensis]